MFDRILARLAYRARVLSGRAPRRVVFLHIPKCGGSSMHYHFKANYGSQRSGRTVMLDSMEGSAFDPASLARARTALYVAGHFGWDTLCAVDQNAFRFTILREPFKRLVSLYFYARRLERSAHPGFAKLVEAAKRLPFDAFCLNPDPQARALIDNTEARALASDYAPTSTMDNDAIIRAATNNLAMLDFVGDTQELDEAFPAIARSTHTTLIRGKTKLNRTGEEPVRIVFHRDFLADPDLRSRIELDVEIYERFRIARALCPKSQQIGHRLLRFNASPRRYEFGT
ncbi:MAG: sulfotransferase family 2 domain-containing protein [Alphaproteobacteria bacterium]